MLRRWFCAGLGDFHAAASALYRRDGIERDLEFYLGPKWYQRIKFHSYLPSIESYCVYLEKLEKEKPLLVAAHALTQLLAMTAGGSLLAKMIRKSFGLNHPETVEDKMVVVSSQGTEAFVLPEGNGAALKQHLKDSADALQTVMTQSELQQFIEEHCRVFEFNNAWISQYPVGRKNQLLAMAKLMLRSKMLWTTFAAVGVLVLARYAYTKFSQIESWI